MSNCKYFKSRLWEWKEAERKRKKKGKLVLNKPVSRKSTFTSFIVNILRKKYLHIPGTSDTWVTRPPTWNETHCSETSRTSKGSMWQSEWCMSKTHPWCTWFHSEGPSLNSGERWHNYSSAHLRCYGDTTKEQDLNHLDLIRDRIANDFIVLVIP